VGTKNQRVFGESPKTMEEVLDMLVKQVLVELGSSERSFSQSRITQALMFEIQKNFNAALEIYNPVLGFILEKKAVAAAEVEQERLDQERQKQKEKEKEKEKEKDGEAELQVDVEEVREEKESKAKNTLRMWLELEHHARFNIASVHLHEGKEELATKEFEDAELVRKQIFEQAEKQVLQWQQKLQGRFEIHFDQLVMRASQFTGGIRTQALFERWAALSRELSGNLGPVRESYEKARGYLFEELHQNYEDDAKKQEDLNIALDLYAKELNRRRELVIGTHVSTDAEVRTRTFMSSSHLDLQKNSLKHLVRDFARELSAYEDQEGVVAEQERLLLKQELEVLSRSFKSQTKGLEILDAHNIRFRLLGNARIHYYRQLQAVSDMVAIPDEPDSEGRLQTLRREEGEVRKSIATLEARVRYLRNLGRDGDLECGICKGELVGGMLTECGHTFCETCIMLWVVKHRSCPMCHYRLTKLDQLKRVTFDKGAGEDELTRGEHHPALVQTAIEGSFGTKLEAVVRYIKHLSQTDSEAKSLVFSQWEQVLGIFILALQKNNIRFVRLEGQGKKEAVKAFRTNPDIRVFILNAKNQSSGLTLVAATHVFLIEPVLNPAIELQAISRVHRIGQTKPSHVHRIIIRDTVENKVFELSERDHNRGHQDAAAHGVDLQDETALPVTFQHPKEGGRSSGDPLSLS